MSENVNIDLSGEINATAEKKGFQKYVNDMEFNLVFGMFCTPQWHKICMKTTLNQSIFTDPAVGAFVLGYVISFDIVIFVFRLMQHFRGGGGQALLMGFLASRRPWTQFVATDNFKPPASLPRLTRRFYRNVEYFQANYVMVFLGLFVYCLVTSPLLLIAMVASFFGYRKLTSGPNTWKIGSWELTKTQQYAVAAAGCTAVCWFAGAGAVVFWVLGVTVTVVALHASLFDAEALPPPDDAAFPTIEQV